MALYVQVENIYTVEGVCLSTIYAAFIHLHVSTSFCVTLTNKISLAYYTMNILSFSHVKTGDGHYFPLGAYHALKGMELILDVAKYKYGFHWVLVDALWDAMGAIDEGNARICG